MNDWTHTEWRLVMRAASGGELTTLEVQQVRSLVLSHRGSESFPVMCEPWVRGYCDALLTVRLDQLAEAIAVADAVADTESTR